MLSLSNLSIFSARLFTALLFTGVLAEASVGQAAVKTYQVTGPVLAVDDTTITVEKGKEKWTVMKDAAAPAGDVKVGDKVTITYKMVATSVESKPAKK